MRAGRRKQRGGVLRPRKEEARAPTSPKSPHQSEGTELPEISRTTIQEVDETEEVQEEGPSAETEASRVNEAPKEAQQSPKEDTQLPVHKLSDKQREVELEAKQREARSLVEARRSMLDQQELARRQQEENQRRRKRRERHNKKKRENSVECSNKGPGSGSEDEAQSESDDHSFEESSQDENPFELCYSPGKEGPKVESDSHKPPPNIVHSGYQLDEPKRVLIEDNYKGMDNWEPGQARSSLTSCWSGVVSQLCGSSQLWMNLPLVSMFAYDPVPDAQ